MRCYFQGQISKNCISRMNPAEYCSEANMLFQTLKPATPSFVRLPNHSKLPEITAIKKATQILARRLVHNLWFVFTARAQVSSSKMPNCLLLEVETNQTSKRSLAPSPACSSRLLLFRNVCWKQSFLPNTLRGCGLLALSSSPLHKTMGLKT